MFVSERVTLRVSPEEARARLVALAGRDGLGGLAHAAYEGGAEELVRVGPLGQARGPTKLVRVLFLEPAEADGTVTIGMRWEAVGISGGLFPVLDANLSLAADGEDSAALAFEGSYRPPFGGLGASLDKALLNKVATATVRALLRDVASLLEDRKSAGEGS
ncbi:MAG TPA: hypothetical protein VMA95_00780 [Streptosporangiaceae bacterium]|nr:hypothetical protein [Streptosporangiaceae bacterium]